MLLSDGTEFPLALTLALTVALVPIPSMRQLIIPGMPLSRFRLMWAMSLDEALVSNVPLVLADTIVVVVSIVMFVLCCN